jgi:DNA-binding CsgD family transcriptional regulator
VRAVADAHALVRLRFPELETTLVTGPYGEPPPLSASYAGLSVVRSARDLPRLLAKATLVVSQAGYNAIAELRALAKPAVLVPGRRKAEDQRARALRLARVGAATIARPEARSLADAIEALVATGDVERAKRLAEALHAWGRRFERPWALATSGRCRALLAAAAGDLDGAVTAAVEALVAHERLPFPFEEARTLLVLGQLQRRRGERRDARATLERAAAIFERIGARRWLEKANSEIARIGVRRAPTELTESEQRVAELAAAGLTNPEIAARLFMSRRTVEANLARAYRKLDIRSRAELGAVMAGRKASPPS